MIRSGDITAQAAIMTHHMRDVMLLIEEGKATFGRAVAQEVKVPYPQAYRTLNTLMARGFLSSEYGPEGTNVSRQKHYYLTDAGQRLLDQVRGADLPDVKHAKTGDVDPDAYARRMRASKMLKWLQDLGLVENLQELEHITTCAECTKLIKQYGLDGDLRCRPYVESLENCLD